MVVLVDLSAVKLLFGWPNGVGIVHAKYAPIIFVMQGQVVSNSVWPFPGWRNAPGFDFPPITIISVHLAAVHGKKLF